MRKVEVSGEFLTERSSSPPPTPPLDLMSLLISTVNSTVVAFKVLREFFTVIIKNRICFWEG